MTKKITISVPDELHEKMEKWKSSFNFSGIFQKAISEAIQKKELFKLKLKEEKTIRDVWNEGSFETSKEAFNTGKEMGFIYAKSKPYHEIKPYEEYIEGWQKEDNLAIETIHYDLDITSILYGMGVLEKDEDPQSLPEGDDIRYFDFESFEWGFMTGLMEYIQEECSSVELGKIMFERDKKLVLVKYEYERDKIIMDYNSKILKITDKEV